jgi:hypothetical protein
LNPRPIDREIPITSIPKFRQKDEIQNETCKHEVIFGIIIFTFISWLLPNLSKSSCEMIATLAISQKLI